MIKHFSVLYVGQIELENVGRDGTPADARRYPNERLIESFGMAEEVAVLMDELGFYALWTYQPGFRDLAQPQIDRVLALAGMALPPTPASNPAKPSTQPAPATLAPE